MTKFNEIGRITVNGSKDMVASSVTEDGELKGINFNFYIKTDRYTGFTKDGLFVPGSKLEEFGELVRTVLAN